MITRIQLNRLARGLPLYVRPSVSADVYLAPEIFAGDTTDTSAAVISGGFPTPVADAVSVLLAGVSQGTGYTTTSADIGKVLRAQQPINNSAGTTVSVSAPVTVVAPVTFRGMGRMGGNIESSQEYRHQRLFNNAVLDSRGWGIPNSNTAGAIAGVGTLGFSASSGAGVTVTASYPSAFAGNSGDVGMILNAGGASAIITAFVSASVATVTITGSLSSTAGLSWTQQCSLDSKGYPQCASQNLLTVAPLVGVDGQLPAGSYHGSYTSPNQTSSVTGSGLTVSNVQQGADGRTTTFDLAVPAGSNGALTFSGPISDVEIPRDGSYPGLGQARFSSVAIAFYSQFSCLRTMDFLGTNARTDTGWATRPPNYVCMAGMFYSWEMWAEFCNACAAYPGSLVTSVWVNIPPYTDLDYATNLRLLIDSLLNPSLVLYVEFTNEPWNPTFIVYNKFVIAAAAAAQIVSVYPGNIATVSSVSASGTLVTVTLNSPITAFPYIGQTVGSTTNCVIANTNDPAWNSGSLASPALITLTDTGSVTGHAVFTYANTHAAGSAGTATWAAFFNLSSPIIADGLSWNVYDIPKKYYVNRVHDIRADWIKTRPNDRFIVNTQMWGGAVGGANAANRLPIEIPYARWLGGGTATWLYGTAIAPYINTTGASTTLDQAFAELNGTSVVGLVTITNYIRSHCFQNRAEGLHPLVYECGTALDLTPNLIASASVDPRMKTTLTALFNAIWGQGVELANFFHVGPAVYRNHAGDQWALTEDYADSTSSLRWAAWKAFYSAARNYANINGAPGTLLAKNFQNGSAAVGAGTVVTTGGTFPGTTVFYWFASNVARQVDLQAAVPRTRRYLAVIRGTDSAANALALLLVDGVQVGTALIAQGGVGSSVSSNLADCVGIPVVLSAGMHVVSVAFAANNGTQVGIAQVDLKPY